MDKTSCRLTVFFENPFWVGIIECNEDGKLTASKITFYKEPKDYEIRDFILKKYNQLNYLPQHSLHSKNLSGLPQKHEKLPHPVHMPT